MTRYDNAEDVYYRGSETKARLRNYSWLRVRPIYSDIGTFKVTTQTAGSPRRIAQQIYGDHRLFWVLALFNSRWHSDARATSVLNWPVAGQILYYPRRYVINPTLT